MREQLCASYTDPRLAKVYDPLNAQADSASRGFFVSLAGPSAKNILDVGCGTGLLACELSALGHGVVGVDAAPAMLDLARLKPGSDRITWVRADAARFTLAARFDLIVMTGHVFQVFLEDEHVIAVLRNLRRHLAPNGRMAFDSRNPQFREWVDWKPHKTVEQVDVPELGTVTVHYDIHSTIGQYVTFQTHFRFAEQDTVVTTSTLRFMAQEDIAKALDAAGFSNVRWFGDYKATDFTEDSPEIIAIAHE